VTSVMIGDKLVEDPMGYIVEIVRETTAPIRKGPATMVDGKAISIEALEERLKKNAPGVYELFDFPSKDEIEPDPDLRFVDCHFILVAVSMKKAMEHKDELKALLAGIGWLGKRQEVSYIEAGGEIGDQGLAFLLFALGEALSFWKVLTPRRVLGADIPQDVADLLAGRGLVTANQAA